VNPELFSLAGRTALITGASSGIGRRMATTLGDAGARVGLVARRAEELRILAKEIGDAMAIAADLSDITAVDEIVDNATEQLGPIDILVNNAAFIAGGVQAEDETPEQIQTTLAVNLIAPIRLAQLVFPTMRERGQGSIINVSSMVARVGIGAFPQATYAASKGGLEAITREWAAQWSRHGIRVNAIAPGFIATEMTAPVIETDRVQSWIKRNTLLPRHGRPDDFDGALLFLASEAGSYVTGQTIVVDGGWTAR
jgi:hypothetical protein